MVTWKERDCVSKCMNNKNIRKHQISKCEDIQKYENPLPKKNQDNSKNINDSFVICVSTRSVPRGACCFASFFIAFPLPHSASSRHFHMYFESAIWFQFVSITGNLCFLSAPLVCPDLPPCRLAVIFFSYCWTVADDIRLAFWAPMALQAAANGLSDASW